MSNSLKVVEPAFPFQNTPHSTGLELHGKMSEIPNTRHIGSHIPLPRTRQCVLMFTNLFHTVIWWF